MKFSQYKFFRGVNIEERIDIHTQTFGQQRKAPRVVKPVTSGRPNNYLTNEQEMGSDTEWKTQSLPSLGHVSSGNINSKGLLIGSIVKGAIVQ